jgi:hypothetical protein
LASADTGESIVWGSPKAIRAQWEERHETTITILRGTPRDDALDSAELERLMMAELLDTATLARIAHLGRFFTRLGDLAGPAITTVEDVLTEQEVQAIWRETADPRASDADIGPHPLLH